jgi:molecular chaperone HscC
MIVGIDLGTTHSLVGSFTPDGPQLYPNALGDWLTPSVVSVDTDGHVIVGRAAQDRGVTHPHLTAAAFKRAMGTDRAFPLGARTFRAEELSALVLRSLIADAEAATGKSVTEAVISVPAYFSDAQRKATRTAGELAGIRVDRLVNEPTAAALAYGLQERRGGTKFLVFDLGGGTFDVSILEMFDGVIEVHATAGDNFLGGEDFLDAMQAACCADLGLDLSKLSLGAQGQLRYHLEAAKRALSAHQSAGIRCTLDAREIEWSVDESRFNELVEHLLLRLRKPIERALLDAHLPPESLSEIVLVGGASRMPAVARTITRMFGRLPLRHVDPDLAIALGACIAAGMKDRDQKLEEVILTDVCSYSLGVACAKRDPRTNQETAGYFQPIIQRNSTVPVSREETFYPMREDQSRLKIEVYQGESPIVANNLKLGQIELGIPTDVPMDRRTVRVRFTYDVNGVLQVEATLACEGITHELIIAQSTATLNSEQIRNRFAALSALKVHPRDKQENIAMLARTERLYEERLDMRPVLQEWLARFRTVIERQDEREIRAHREELVRALGQLESTW